MKQISRNAWNEDARHTYFTLLPLHFTINSPPPSFHPSKTSKSAYQQFEFCDWNSSAMIKKFCSTLSELCSNQLEAGHWLKMQKLIINIHMKTVGKLMQFLNSVIFFWTSVHVELVAIFVQVFLHWSDLWSILTSSGVVKV